MTHKKIRLHLFQQFGLVITGLVGFICETLCLTMCVASVFAPGSPFDASALLRHSGTLEGGQSTPTLITPLNHSITTATPLVTLAAPEYVIGNDSSMPGNVRNLVVDFNSTLEEHEEVEELPFEYGLEEGKRKAEDFTFVILLLAGIITSRFGEWKLR